MIPDMLRQFYRGYLRFAALATKPVEKSGPGFVRWVANGTVCRFERNGGIAMAATIPGWSPEIERTDVIRAKKIAAAMDIHDRGRGHQFDPQMVGVLARVVQ
jgi:hypothetical protein